VKYNYVSQLLQARGMQIAIEAHRRKTLQYGNFILAIERLLACCFMVFNRLFRKLESIALSGKKKF
jgi:hypothetical protein